MFTGRHRHRVWHIFQQFLRIAVQRTEQTQFKHATESTNLNVKGTQTSHASIFTVSILCVIVRFHSSLLPTLNNSHSLSLSLSHWHTQTLSLALPASQNYTTQMSNTADRQIMSALAASSSISQITNVLRVEKKLYLYISFGQGKIHSLHFTCYLFIGLLDIFRGNSS